MTRWTSTNGKPSSLNNSARICERWPIGARQLLVSPVMEGEDYSERRKLTRSCFWLAVSELKLAITMLASEPLLR